MAEFILREVQGPIGIITLNRPQVMNAWHAAMREELVQAFDEMEANDAVRAVILTGAGDRAFGTIELTLTGRMMDADECYRIGIINQIVPQSDVMQTAIKLATELAQKAPIAMKLNRQRFREITQPGFEDAMAAGIRTQRAAYATGEPARMMEAFLAKRAARKA